MTILDTLKLSRALRGAGMAPEQAEAVTEALNDAFTSQAAEKRNLDEVRNDLGARIEAVCAELKRGIDVLRAELKRDLEAVRGELEHDIETLGARLTFQQWQLGAILAVLVGLLIKLVVFHP